MLGHIPEHGDVVGVLFGNTATTAKGRAHRPAPAAWLSRWPGRVARRPVSGCNPLLADDDTEPDDGACRRRESGEVA